MGKLVIESIEKKLNLRKIAKAVYVTLGQKARIKAELVFASAEEIHNLNAETRGVDKVTDVLSYPTLEGIRGQILRYENCVTEMDRNYIFLGSVVLCEEKIKEQAIEFGHGEEVERTYLIIHGLLHLFGYDHETEEDKKEMRDKEKAILAYLERR
jgi:probable rRNA maturation factor